MIKKNLIDYQLKTHVKFGADVINQVGEFARELGDKIVLVTNGSAYHKYGYISKMKTLIEKNNLKLIIYEDITTDIKSDTVDEIGELVRKSKANLVIGLGGITVMNVTKAVALLSTNEGSITDYLNGMKMTTDPVPFMLIPTIPGSYFDLSNDMIISDYADNYKKMFSDSRMEAAMAVIDPKLMTTIPANFTAATALNSLVLAIESYISTTSNPISDSFSPRAIEYTMKSLKSAVTDRDNLEGRWNIAMGGILSSMSSRIAGLGTSSAIAFTLASKYNIYQSVAAAIIIPHVMEFNLTAVPGKYVQIAKNMGEDVASITVVEAAIKAIESIRKVLFDLKIPQRLSEYNVENEDIPLIAGHAREFTFLNNVPRPISREDIINILMSAF